MYVEKIKSSRKNILTGEIGVLLHDIGKCHPDFIKSKSIEKTASDEHAQIDKFLEDDLVSYIKDKKFKFRINNIETDIYSLIAKHHDDTTDQLVNLLKTCDHKDSADDKGIVRRQQALDNIIISSPFGYPKGKINLKCLQKRFEDLQDNLKGLFKNYISDEIDLSCFRKGLLNNLRTTFSQALGETRIPANDVTLWDHSYSTAALFKTILVGKACGGHIDEKKWRIFGVCWRGEEFINQGQKIAEIQKRVEILDEIKSKLKMKFEDEIPLGNSIYEDINSIYFTFPDLTTQSKDLARECSEEVLSIINATSANELWPFFTLSEPSSTLTIIANELDFSSKKRKIPRMKPILFIKNDGPIPFENPPLFTPGEGEDVCPVCKVRLKKKEEERCEVCEDRRKGRLESWFNNRENTIWTDEVADKNNRVALLSLNFDLDKWLDGTMIGTIFSQTFEEWLQGGKYTRKKTQNIIKDKKIAQTSDLKSKALNIAEWITNNSEMTEAKVLLECFIESGDVENILEDIKNRLKNIKNNPEDIKKIPNKILLWFFTQNPSPARIYRIWKETEEFFELLMTEIINKIYPNKWKRLKFSIDYNELKSKLRQGGELKENTPYLIEKEELSPRNLLVLHTKNGEFYTIESLDKFKFKDKTGEFAVREALDKGFKYLTLENNPNQNLLEKEKEAIKVEENNIKTEEYIPLIEINKSPLSLRMLVLASDSIKILELISKLYNERFEKVLGKLPLNIKLLVTNRKFPLYVLLDAEKRMLAGAEFRKAVSTNVWWNLDALRSEEFYGYYPTKNLEEGKYTLDDLSPLSKDKIYQIFPGYFDFELLSGTTDRYNIYYEGENRGDRNYKLFSKRPYYQYQFSELLELWDILTANISSSQIAFIEEAFTTKLREWRKVEDNNKEDVFKEFAEATLKDAFGKKWSELGEETRFLLINSSQNKVLLDTIILFRHILKKGVEKE
ncbi:MAG: CRISPR-associated protein Csx11 [Candidatus Atribacteria bacterium]|nr:CRISPR-associated protein Csx11 [Candidatus Atribacteria bacterium]